MIESILNEARENMEKAIVALQGDLATIRTGRASPALVERLAVEYYGVSTPLNQIASISAPEANLLVIRPWDDRILPEIERAIRKSDLGLTPTNDGHIIRLAVPHLTEERRRELVRLVGRRLEQARVAIRNLRRAAINDLRELEREKMITQDDLYRNRDEVQKLTDEYVEKVAQFGQAKEEEIMEF